MADDVSNTTIAVLLILTILVSVIGTWTVLDTAKEKVNPGFKDDGLDKAKSHASIQIKDPIPPVTAGGETSIQILDEE